MQIRLKPQAAIILFCQNHGYRSSDSIIEPNGNSEKMLSVTFIDFSRLQSYIIITSFTAHCRTERPITIENSIPFCYTPSFLQAMPSLEFVKTGKFLAKRNL